MPSDTKLAQMESERLGRHILNLVPTCTRQASTSLDCMTGTINIKEMVLRDHLAHFLHEETVPLRQTYLTGGVDCNS